jgi:dsDNA-specific endonuclease/ATPase MutS2
MSQKNKTKSKNLPTLDLHGYVVDDVFDALDRFLRTAEERGHPWVRIITGKGTGKVRAKTLEYLKLAHYKPQPEPHNEGSFVVAIL